MTSAINPNDINGNYPVAGQDNNSQGFRDNFTNTKTNFQYAADEITEIQNKAVFKSAITGQSLNNDMLGNPISNVVLNNARVSVVQNATVANIIVSSTNPAVPAGGYQVVTTPVYGNVNLNITSWPAAGSYATVRVQLPVPNIANVTMGSGIGSGVASTSLRYIKGYQGNNIVKIDTTANANANVIVFEFSSYDGGSTIFIQDLTRGANATPF